MSNLAKPRYEDKYVIPAAAFLELQKQIRSEFSEDSNTHGNESYWVTSLYYDTPEFQCYFDKIDGSDPRFKLRLRTYDCVPSEEGYYGLEIKWRTDTQISKGRLVLSKEGKEQLLKGNCPLTPSFVQDHCTGDEAQKEVFATLLTKSNLQPQVVVQYRRKPMIYNRDPNLRITFDQYLRYGSKNWFMMPSNQPLKSFLPKHLGILEVKYHWALPLWVIDVLRSLGLESRRYSKYASALEAIYPHLTNRALRVAPVF